MSTYFLFLKDRSLSSYFTDVLFEHVVTFKLHVSNFPRVIKSPISGQIRNVYDRWQIKNFTIYSNTMDNIMSTSVNKIQFYKILQTGEVPLNP